MTHRSSGLYIFTIPTPATVAITLVLILPEEDLTIGVCELIFPDWRLGSTGLLLFYHRRSSSWTRASIALRWDKYQIILAPVLASV